MAIRPVIIDKRSPFLGEACALCKEPFSPGQEIVVCPVDATRHHDHCWQANDNKCTAYGCTGHGEIEDYPTSPNVTVVRRRNGRPEAKVQTLPTRSFHCAQSCLLLAIALAIILFAVGCFGLWAIADYIMVDILGWQYREPISELLPLYNTGSIQVTVISTITLISQILQFP